MRLGWIGVAIVAVALAWAPARAADESAEALEGYWVSDTRMERAGGELSIKQDGAKWSATLGSSTIVFQPAGRDVRVAFAAGTGAFRGRIAPDGKTIDGFWIQDGDQGQPLATPLHLAREGDTWRGTVVPLDLRFTLYLRVFKREDGVLIAAFRNPQRNTRGGGSRLYVKREGDTVRFLERDDGKPRENGSPAIVHTATFVSGPDRIRMKWPEIGEDVELVRKSASEVEGYFPRAPAASTSYARPAELGDGWSTASAADAGFDEAALAGLVQRIVQSDPAERQPKLIHSLLIARKGKLVLEEYFFGQPRETLHDMRSAGKTFTSVMLGALMQRGDKISPATKITSLLDTGPVANPSPDKNSITLAHLLTHTSGLACNDSDEASPGNEDVMQSQAAERDWLKYALDLPMQHKPGARYAYCTAGINLAGGGIAASRRAWLPALFDETVARPLQFGSYAWNLAPNGEGYAGGGSRLRSRDLLKVGQLYLDRGVWNGKRVVSRDWVERSTAPIVPINEATTGLDSETLHNTYPGGADGYAWHTFTVTAGGRSYREYEAAGNGGQMLIVIPELELTVVMTGGNYNQGFIWGRWRDEIVGAQIVPAIVK